MPLPGEAGMKMPSKIIVLNHKDGLLFSALSQQFFSFISMSSFLIVCIFILPSFEKSMINSAHLAPKSFFGTFISKKEKISVFLVDICL